MGDFHNMLIGTLKKHSTSTVYYPECIVVMYMYCSCYMTLRKVLKGWETRLHAWGLIVGRLRDV